MHGRPPGGRVSACACAAPVRGARVFGRGWRGSSNGFQARRPRSAAHRAFERQILELATGRHAAEHESTAAHIPPPDEGERGSSGAVTDLQRRQLGLIYSAALGLNNLASDALELALDRDRLVEKDPAPFSITEVLEAVRSIVHPVAEEKGLEIRLRLPTADHRLGQPVALGRVLLNLTTNALKFTDEGYVELSAAEPAPDRVELSVRDTGPGVNPDALPSLFQPFRRARARGGIFFSGTGLGLAICRKLVRAMGSELQLETRPQWGTRFYFELPLPTI